MSDVHFSVCGERTNDPSFSHWDPELNSQQTKVDLCNSNVTLHFQLAVFCEFHFACQENNETFILKSEELWEKTEKFVFPWISNLQRRMRALRDHMLLLLQWWLIMQLTTFWPWHCIYAKMDSSDYKMVSDHQEIIELKNLRYIKI